MLRRDLVISGFYAKNLTGAINIKIFGVVTPNRVNNNPTGYFGLAYLDVDGFTALETNFSIPGVVPSLAPEGISLINFKSDTNYCRYLSTYTFQFKPL